VGNLNQAYQIVDRRGILVIRDNVTTPGKVKWYFTKRTGGDVVNSEAVRFIEFKA
jgi:HK97 family phage major capsid protein